VPLLTVLGAGCDPPGKPNLADRPVPADQVVNFDALYKTNCAGCHGADGKLGPAPPLNDPIFLHIVPDAVLRHVITDGRQGTPMPAFAKKNGGPLTDEQINVLASGIKPRWTPAEQPKADPPVYLAPENEGAGDKKAGLAVFARACATCHGSHGQGSKNAGAINDPSFLALVSDQALRRFAITGRPDLGMPNYAGTDDRDPDFQPLTSRQITDLVALLAYWRVGGSVHDK
jgi:cytochrome c oxidase cbb3-type subunit 3/ubiquinol-cytochrome c reductase cytochrome c subunit